VVKSGGWGIARLAGGNGTDSCHTYIIKSLKIRLTDLQVKDFPACGFQLLGFCQEK